MSIFLYISIGLIFLSANAIFNGSETGFVSLDKNYLRYRARAKTATRERRLLKIASSPENFLALTLIGTNSCLVIATSIFTAVFKTFGQPYLQIGTLLISVFIFVFCEFVPKMLFNGRPLRMCVRFLPLYVISEYVFYIPVRIVAYFTHKIMDIAGINRQYKSGKISLSELMILLGHGAASGIIRADTTEMARGIIELKDRNVSEIMIPRMAIVAIEENTSLEEARKIVLKSGFSRIPIYSSEIDHIVGILYFKDLFLRSDGAKSISELMTRPLFIPEMKVASELFKEMKAKKIQVSIVLDEFGSVSGLVTFEDLIEEVVGEIHDEFDKTEESVKQLDDGSIIVPAMMSINDFNDENLDFKFPELDGVNTVNGFIVAKLGRIPKKGETFNHNGYKVEIIESSDRIIETIKIYEGKP